MLSLLECLHEPHSPTQIDVIRDWSLNWLTCGWRDRTYRIQIAHYAIYTMLLYTQIWSILVLAIVIDTRASGSRVGSIGKMTGTLFIFMNKYHRCELNYLWILYWTAFTIDLCSSKCKKIKVESLDAFTLSMLVFKLFFVTITLTNSSRLTTIS